MVRTRIKTMKDKDKLLKVNVIKILGDYGIRKPIFIDIKLLLKWCYGKAIMDHLNPGSYHRSTARNWLWKHKRWDIDNNTEGYPTLHMNNYIATYEQLLKEILSTIKRHIEIEQDARFNERFVSPIASSDKMPFVCEVDTHDNDLRIEITKHHDFKITTTDAIDITNKINDVIRNYKFKKIKNYEKFSKRASRKLIKKWFGIDIYKRNILEEFRNASTI